MMTTNELNLVTLYTGLQGIYGGEPFQCVLKFSTDTDVVITDADMEPDSKFIRNSKRRLDESFFMASSEFDKEFTIFETRNPDKKNQYYLVVGTDFELIMTKYKSYGSIKKKVQEEHDKHDRQEQEKKEVINTCTHEMHIKGIAYDGAYGCHLSMDDIVFNSTPIECDKTPWKYQFFGILRGLKLVLEQVQSVEKIYIHPIEGKNMHGVYKIPLGKWPAYGKDMEYYKNSMLAYRDKFAEKGVSLIFRNI